VQASYELHSPQGSTDIRFSLQDGATSPSCPGRANDVRETPL